MRWGAWSVPPIFNWLQTQGKVEQTEMTQVFNMGIGYVFIVAAADEDALLQRLKGEGVKIGTVEAGVANEPGRALLV
jgi:phosphoribosylformylglycinamidine cyclo-ligase